MFHFGHFRSMSADRALHPAMKSHTKARAQQRSAVP